MEDSMRYFIILIMALFLLCLVNLTYAASLQWDPNTEPDLAGYKIYQTTTPGTYGEAVDVVGKVTTWQIPEDTAECVYWSITAYDFENLESDKSNEVSNCDGEKPATPGTLIYVDVDVNVTVNVGNQ
jgi:hypothetical protein